MISISVEKAFLNVRDVFEFLDFGAGGSKIYNLNTHRQSYAFARSC